LIDAKARTFGKKNGKLTIAVAGSTKYLLHELTSLQLQIKRLPLNVQTNSKSTAKVFALIIFQLY
jgi:hypothetical protein